MQKWRKHTHRHGAQAHTSHQKTNSNNLNIFIIIMRRRNVIISHFALINLPLFLRCFFCSFFAIRSFDGIVTMCRALCTFIYANETVIGKHVADDTTPTTFARASDSPPNSNSNLRKFSANEWRVEKNRQQGKRVIIITASLWFDK